MPHSGASACVSGRRRRWLAMRARLSRGRRDLRRHQCTGERLPDEQLLWLRLGLRSRLPSSSYGLHGRRGSGERLLRRRFIGSGMEVPSRVCGCRRGVHAGASCRRTRTSTIQEARGIAIGPFAGSSTLASYASAASPRRFRGRLVSPEGTGPVPLASNASSKSSSATCATATPASENPYGTMSPLAVHDRAAGVHHVRHVALALILVGLDQRFR